MAKNSRKAPANHAVGQEGEAPDEPFPHQRRWFAALMAAAIAFRLIVGLATKHHLQSDEALVGMIALDIMEGARIPVFPYGNHYAGGHIVEALLMIPLFKIFGPSGAIVSLVPAMIACGYIAIVYALLARFFGRRLALVSAALMAFSPTFLEFNFYVNGGMTTSALAWAGMWCFFAALLAERESPLAAAGAGLFFGLAYWCFDYALFYPLAAMALWTLKHKRRALRQRAFPAILAGGFVVGAAPLIYDNFASGFANFRNLMARTTAPREESFILVRIARRMWGLIAHDLPAFFTLDIYDFPDRTPPWAYLACAIFFIAAAWAAWDRRAALKRALFSRAASPPPREDRLASLIVMLLLYAALYCLSASGGLTPRYLIPTIPFIQILLAWAFLRARSKRPAIAWGALALFAAAQAPFLAKFAADSTTVEWKIVTHGEDLPKLAEFLDGRGISAVACPYEIKWKLMFLTRRRIVCNAALFGFDRDPGGRWNNEAADRVNRRGAPLALVVDQALEMPKIALNFAPDRAFNMDEFHAFLAREGIQYEKTPVGRDYLVYHGFSKPFNLPEPNAAALQR